MIVHAGKRLVDRFEVLERIGTGGMGVVYLAHDRERDERVALKVLRNTDPASIVRFKREFRVLQLAHHRNLVQLGELFAEHDCWFFTMEFVDGVPFVQHVRARPKPAGAMDDTAVSDPASRVASNERALRSCMQQLVLGLLSLHTSGMIHRDIKPTNVMVTGDGRVVILDFGLVAEADPALQSTEAFGIGTPEYVSPEQAAGSPVSAASDWYSVGVMLFEALTGTLPFTGTALRIFMDKQQREPPSVRELAPGASDDLLELCEQLLRIDPAQRPSGLEVAARLGLNVGGPQTSSAPLSRVTRSSAFVGRSPEMMALHQAHAQSRERAQLVLIEGESGIGKTELMHRFVSGLESADPALLVLDSRCFESESVPYKALDGAIDRLARALARLPDSELEPILPVDAALLPRLFPVLRRVDAIAGATIPQRIPEDPHEQRRRIQQALRLLLRRAANLMPMVIAIDDLHWADEDSFSLLSKLFAGAKSPPILLLATRRADLGVGTDALSTDLETTTVQLPRLTDDDARELAVAIEPTIEQSPLLARIVAESHGHPLFVHELVRYVADGAGEVNDIRLEQAIAARVEMLSDQVRTLLEAACAASAPLLLDIAAQVCGIEPASLGRAVATLKVALLVRTQDSGARAALEPYHGRVRSAVLGRLSTEHERELHRQLARAFETSPVAARDPQLLVTHFARAGDHARAAHYAEAAAERAEGALAFGQAAELWRVAMSRYPAKSAERHRIQTRLADALVSAGRGAAAARAFLEAADAPDIGRSRELVCRRKAAEQLLLSGRMSEGLEVLESVLAAIGVSPPRSRRRGLLSVLLRRAWLRLRGSRWRWRERREIPEADLVRVEIISTAGKGLALVDSVRGADCQVRAFLLALRLGEAGAVGHALALEASYQANQGSVRRSRALMKKATAVAATLRDPHLDAMHEVIRGICAYFAGEFSDAERRCSDGERMLASLPWAVWEANSARLFRLFAMREIGDLQAMKAEYSRCLSEAIARGDRYAESSIRRCASRVWLMTDDVEAATHDLDRAVWEAPAAGYHVAHFHELTARGEIGLYSGSFDDLDLESDFAQLRASLLMRVVTVRTQACYLAGRLALAGARTGSGDRLKEASRMARRLRRESLGFADAWAAVLSAGVAGARGDTDAALHWLTLVQDHAAAHDMRLLRAAAGFRQGRILGADKGSSLLDWSRRELNRLGVANHQRMAQMMVPVATRQRLLADEPD